MRVFHKHGKVKLGGIFIVDHKEKVSKFLFYKGRERLIRIALKKDKEDCRL